MGPDEKLMMEKMGFSNFTAKWQTNLEEKEEVEVKEERHTFRFEVFISAQLKENMFNAFFRCLVCDLELNSEDTYASHVRGVRHVVSILGKYAPFSSWTNWQKNEKLQSAARGEILVVPPSTQTRVKVPVTLKEKIKECNEPLVGLAYVREVLPLSNQEMEPHYYCDLCNQQGQANCMLLHLKLVPTFTLS